MDTVPVPITKKYNWKKATWDEFKKQLTTEADDIKELWNELTLHNTTENQETAAKTLTNIIKKAVNEHVPPHTISPRSKPWWMEELTTTRKHMNTTLTEWRIDRHPDLWDKYQGRRKEFYNKIKTAGAEHWDKF